ncbi:MAG TPA: hypothetical protein DDW67_05005 [Elusimicrobia bacterium]|jgi:uncharacterized membrane protein|nr:hypothetical protein [Elusimicrobiota bacterium]
MVKTAYSEKDLSKLIQRVLQAGVLLSALCFLLGAAWRGSPAGETFSRAGVMVLLVTPAARVAALLYGYARSRQYLFALSAFIVLALLGAAALV